ncbi:unnamed protein product, partial [Ectocarpus fasciculatus]
TDQEQGGAETVETHCTAAHTGAITRVGIECIHSMQGSGGHGLPPPVVHSPPGLRSAGWEEDVDPPTCTKESVAAWERSLRPGQYFSEKGGHRPMCRLPRVRQDDDVPAPGVGTLLSPERDLRQALRRHSRWRRRWRRRSGSRASSARPCGLLNRSHCRM